MASETTKQYGTVNEQNIEDSIEDAVGGDIAPLASVAETQAGLISTKSAIPSGLLIRKTGTAIIGGELTGNTRGTTSLDIQSARSVATQVASGVNSIAVGINNTSVGLRSASFGYGNVANGTDEVALGVSNTVGNGSTGSVGVGVSNTVDDYSVAFGHLNSILGATCTASGYYNSADATVYRSHLYGMWNTANASSQYCSGLGYQNTVGDDYSSAFGANNIATGAYSTASGYYNIANNIYSNAFGSLNDGQGVNSTLVGLYNFTNIAPHHSGIAVGILNNQQNGTFNTTTGAITGTPIAATTIGKMSTAIGINNQTQATAGIVIGYECQANGSYGTASGYQTYANATRSTASGYRVQLTANGQDSSGFGNNISIDEADCSAIGENITIPAGANYHQAFGADITVEATSGYSVSIGTSFTNSGYVSTLITPYQGTCSGDYAIRIGGGGSGSADGASAVSIGDSAQADGTNALAMGSNANASGTSSTASGNYSTASGNYSTALGANAEARIQDTTVIAGPIINRKDNGESAGATLETYSGVEVTLATKEIDLKIVASHTITIPTGSTFYPNEAHVIATAADTVTNQATVSYGITADKDKFKVAAQLTKSDVVKQRERFITLLTEDGEQTLVADVTNGATATTSKGRVVFKGLLIEDE